MINIEIWASGSGTNADAICSYFSDDKRVNVKCIACNRRDAGVFDVAKKHGINGVYFDVKSWNPSTLLTQLNERKVDFIVLAGFLKLVPKEVIDKYEGRIVNIHPSLLPKYGGKHMYGEHVHKAVLANKETHTGITIHEVDEAFDNGKKLAQYSTHLEAGDDLNAVKKKIQTLEHTHYAPTILAWIKSKA